MFCSTSLETREELTVTLYISIAIVGTGDGVIVGRGVDVKVGVTVGGEGVLVGSYIRVGTAVGVNIGIGVGIGAALTVASTAAFTLGLEGGLCGHLFGNPSLYSGFNISFNVS